MHDRGLRRSNNIYRKRLHVQLYGSYCSISFPNEAIGEYPPTATKESNVYRALDPDYPTWLFE